MKNSWDEYCERQDCSVCPFRESNPWCKDIFKGIKGVTGNGKRSAKKTLSTMERILELLYNYGTGREEFTPYQKYCIDKAISALLDAEE